MKDVSQVTACVIDNNLFFPLAQRLAKDYKRVLYTTTRKHGFSTLNDCVVGDGFDDVERVDDFWTMLKEIDLFVFPDIEQSGLQLHLEEMGHAVWGSRTGDSLEIQRQKFLNTLEKLGLRVPSFTTVKGITNLKNHLKNEENKYVKISKYRGSMETWHWRNWKLDEGFLDVLAVRFGPAGELIPFLVFDNIDTDLEIGGDTYCVDGMYPAFMVNGLEWKDKGYLGAVTEAKEMPEQIQAVLSAFSPVLEGHRYRNFWSMELRVDGEDSYFIDPCCRFPCPAYGSQLALYGNLPEIIWSGANGELVQPELTAKFSAECVLTAKSEKHQWGVIEVPKKLQDHVLCGGCCQIDGRLCFPPDETHGDEIGWLVATGDTILEAIETMKGYTELLPDGVHANTESLFELLKEAHSAEEQGVQISDQKIPPPSVAMDND